jgi:hypothetical protein
VLIVGLKEMYSYMWPAVTGERSFSENLFDFLANGLEVTFFLIPAVARA